MSLLIAPIRMDLIIIQGATWRQTFIWKAGDSEALALPVDLTGCTARTQLRETFAAPTAFVSLTTENGGIALNGTPGEITLMLSATASAALPNLVKPARWDLEIVWPSTEVTRLFEGKVTIDLEVTRG